jgi:2-C-methyl-D-erythritol 4-phosphate cytidylyltransferase
MTAHGQLTVAVIVVAAGTGSRLGADIPKAFVTVAGQTLLEHACATFLAHEYVRDVVVVVPAASVEVASALLARATVVAGGQTRQGSAAAGLAVVGSDVDVVLVHDAARAFVPPDMITRVVDAVRTQQADAAVPVLPLTDTVRRCDPASGELGELVDRSRLLAMQTPQGFRREALVSAHARAVGLDATDDAALIEAIGGRVVAVRGDERAFKITVPLDLVLAEAVARG